MQVDLKSDNAANWEIPQFRKKKKNVKTWLHFLQVLKDLAHISRGWQ